MSHPSKFNYMHSQVWAKAVSSSCDFQLYHFQHARQILQLPFSTGSHLGWLNFHIYLGHSSLKHRISPKWLSSTLLFNIQFPHPYLLPSPATYFRFEIVLLGLSTVYKRSTCDYWSSLCYFKLHLVRHLSLPNTEESSYTTLTQNPMSQRFLKGHRSWGEQSQHIQCLYPPPQEDILNNLHPPIHFSGFILVLTTTPQVGFQKGKSEWE